MNNSKSADKTNWPLVFTTTTLLLISAFEYGAILLWDGIANQDKVTAFLSVIGAYGLGIGFFSKIKDLGKPIRTLLAELISTNAAAYIAANFTYLGTIMSTLALGLNSRKTKYPSPIIYLLSSLALIIIGLGVFVYVLFHLFIVLPLSYPAVLIAGSVVNSFETANGDHILAIRNVDSNKIRVDLTEQEDTNSEDEVTRVSLKAVVTKDKVAATGFIMGLPAFVLALIGKILLPFI